MRIANNMSAIVAQNKLQATQRKTSTKSEKLSSGFRINRSADDAAGLAISEKMRAQIRGLKQAGRNVQEEIDQLKESINNIAHATNFNRINLFISIPCYEMMITHLL